jgi:raw score 9.88
MMVKQILQARETQFYPQKGIRSCHALVVTESKSYQTDYSVILNDKGFFIQVENVQ